MNNMDQQRNLGRMELERFEKAFKAFLKDYPDITLHSSKEIMISVRNSSKTLIL